jgi:1,5-anhydro-D-fructose reductase (1,5-anhydro-D-mannitol-forming)
LNNKIGWGLIGASNIARERLGPAINDAGDSKVVAVMGSDLVRTRQYARAGGFGTAYDDVEALVADPAVDAVYISSTNEKHAPAAIAAAKARKHVLCEKPMALNLNDARAMIDACRMARVVLGVNHHLRQMETHRVIQKLISEGAIGKPITARMFFGVLLPGNLLGWRVRNPEMGGGVLFDLSVHEADVLQFLLSEPLTELTAMTASAGVAENGLADTAVIVARTRSGVLAQITDSFVIGHSDTGIEIHGAEGSIFARDVFLQDAGGTVQLRKGAVVETLEVRHVNAYARVIRLFNDAILGKGVFPVDGEAGYRSLAFALAAEKSASTGQTIALGIDE